MRAWIVWTGLILLAVPVAADDADLFEELIHLDRRQTQILLRETDQKDLALALVGASDTLTAYLLAAMSQRVQAYIRSEISYIGATVSPEDVRWVRQSIVQNARTLSREYGASWPPDPDGPAHSQRDSTDEQSEIPPPVWDDLALRVLIARPYHQLSYAEVAELFAMLSDLSRREGILSLEPLAQVAADRALWEAITLVVDGTEPALVRDILETELLAQTSYLKMRHTVIIEGLASINSGDNPRIIEHKLKVIYAVGAAGGAVTNPDLDSLSNRIVGMGEKARRQFVSSLEEDARQENSALLKTGLYLIIDQVPIANVIELLERRAAVLVMDYELRRRLLIEGIGLIQKGASPKLVQETLVDVTQRFPREPDGPGVLR